MSTSSLNLFAIPIHVKRLDGAAMPEKLLGAYLVCYVFATDHLRALKLAVERLRQEHYQFLDLSGEISQLDPDWWDRYVQATWPEAGDVLPKQSDIMKRLDREDVFYGPFCCYDKDAP